MSFYDHPADEVLRIDFTLRRQRTRLSFEQTYVGKLEFSDVTQERNTCIPRFSEHKINIVVVQKNKNARRKQGNTGELLTYVISRVIRRALEESG